MRTDDPKSYKENYAILEKIADQLQNEEDIDIDSLVPMVEQASKAFTACKARLDEVEKALAQKLENSDDDQTI